MQTPPSLFARILLVVSMAYPIFIFSVFPNWVIDDAIIGYRYSENLALHGSLTWNIGEPPVEGYTGILLPVAVAGGIALGADPFIVSRWIGIFSFFLAGLFLFLTLRSLRIRDTAASFVLLLYSTTPVFFTHATSGMETMLFIAALFFSLYAFARFLSDGGRGKSSVLSLALLLTSLVRPEGVAFSGLVFLTALYFQYKHRRHEIGSFIAAFTSVYFLPALAYFLWRWNYYGALLPNTFYAKRGDWNIYIFLDIMRFLRRTMAVPLFAAAFLIIPQIDFLWEKAKQGAEEFWNRRLSYFFVPCALFSLVLLLFLSHSHTMTNFSQRFYIPFLPFAFLVFAYLFHIGLMSLYSVRRERPLLYICARAVFVVLCLYQVAFQIAKLKPEIVYAREEKIEKESQHYVAGTYLKQLLPPEEWLVVYLDAGAVSYFSRLKVVDFGMLSDTYLAQNDVSIPDRVNYFYSKNPAALFFSSASLDKVVYTAESDAITNDPRFQNYSIAKLIPFPSNLPKEKCCHQFIFLRKDLYDKLKKEGKLSKES